MDNKEAARILLSMINVYKISGDNNPTVVALELAVSALKSTDGRVTNNKSKRWTEQEDELLKELIEQGLSTPKIAKKLGRTTDAVKQRRKRFNVQLV